MFLNCLSFCLTVSSLLDHSVIAFPANNEKAIPPAYTESHKPETGEPSTTSNSTLLGKLSPSSSVVTATKEPAPSVVYSDEKAGIQKQEPIDTRQVTE
jgi:hypothetical protein